MANKDLPLFINLPVQLNALQSTLTHQPTRVADSYFDKIVNGASYFKTFVSKDFEQRIPRIDGQYFSYEYFRFSDCYCLYLGMNKQLLVFDRFLRLLHSYTHQFRVFNYNQGISYQGHLLFVPCLSDVKDFNKRDYQLSILQFDSGEMQIEPVPQIYLKSQYSRHFYKYRNVVFYVNFKSFLCILLDFHELRIAENVDCIFGNDLAFFVQLLTGEIYQIGIRLLQPCLVLTRVFVDHRLFHFYYNDFVWLRKKRYVGEEDVKVLLDQGKSDISKETKHHYQLVGNQYHRSDARATTMVAIQSFLDEQDPKDLDFIEERTGISMGSYRNQLNLQGVQQVFQEATGPLYTLPYMQFEALLEQLYRIDSGAGQRFAGVLVAARHVIQGEDIQYVSGLYGMQNVDSVALVQ